MTLDVYSVVGGLLAWITWIWMGLHGCGEHIGNSDGSISSVRGWVDMQATWAGCRHWYKMHDNGWGVNSGHRHVSTWGET